MTLKLLARLQSKVTILQTNGFTVDRISQITVFLVSMILATGSILYHHGGIIHPEIQTYLPYYLSDGPLINKLYDSKVLDQDMYQARELSYFFDFIDSKFIEWSVSLGHPHFLSITTYIFLLVTGLLIWHFRKIIALPAPTGIALVVLFWTTPSVFLAGIFFRSAKVGVALLAALLFLEIHGYLKAKHQNPKRHYLIRWLVFFGLGWVMTLFDRQGVYLAGMALIFLLFWGIFFPDKNMLLPISAISASLIMSYIYNYMIGPFLTQALNQYSPNFSYQHIPLWKIFKYPLIFAWASISLYLDTIRFMFGNIPLLITGIGLVLLIVRIFFTTYRELRSTGRLSRYTAAGAGAILCNVFLLIAMDALMVLRHNPLFDPDIRRVYYWIPQVTILFLTIAFFLSHIIKENKHLKNIVLLVLILAIAGNIYSLPQHNNIVINGYIKSANEYSPRLIEALQNISNVHYQVPADVLQDPVYQWFETSQMKAEK